MQQATLKAPFPYFGGKSRVADLVWSRFGVVRNFVEPFAGSLAILLARPCPFDGTETVNDKCGFISNFWRAVKAAPDEVAKWADNPVNENDMHAIHIGLVNQAADMVPKLEGDIEYYDAKVAGRWVFGICCWIGSGFCSGQGPWHSVEDAEGVRQLVHLGSAGQGVNRQLVHLGNAGQGVNRQRVHLGNADNCAQSGTPGEASTASEFTLGTPGKVDDIAGKSEGVYEWMRALSERLRLVRVCSGDWSRVCGPTVTIKQGLTAVFLDPPYADTAGRQADLYRVDCDQVAHATREWAIENGGNRQMRICLAGYSGEHVMPDDWEVVEWKAPGGFGSQGDDESQGRKNCRKERLWFSPYCLKATKAQREMFQ